MHILPSQIESSKIHTKMRPSAIFLTLNILNNHHYSACGPKERSYKLTEILVLRYKTNREGEKT